MANVDKQLTMAETIALLAKDVEDSEVALRARKNEETDIRGKVTNAYNQYNNAVKKFKETAEQLTKDPARI